MYNNGDYDMNEARVRLRLGFVVDDIDGFYDALHKHGDDDDKDGKRYWADFKIFRSDDEDEATTTWVDLAGMGDLFEIIRRVVVAGLRVDQIRPSLFIDIESSAGSAKMGADTSEDLEGVCYGEMTVLSEQIDDVVKTNVEAAIASLLAIAAVWR